MVRPLAGDDRALGEPVEDGRGEIEGIARGPGERGGRLRLLLSGEESRDMLVREWTPAAMGLAVVRGPLDALLDPGTAVASVFVPTASGLVAGGGWDNWRGGATGVALPMEPGEDSDVRLERDLRRTKDRLRDVVQ